MGKEIKSDDLWENYSFAIRNDKTGEIWYVKIKDFFEQTKVVGGEE